MQSEITDYLNEIEHKEKRKYGDKPAIKLLDLLSKAGDNIISNYFKVT